ncbi:MAG: tyrosine--tRNA ligase [Oscillospiraceae bacterium]|nr:tyrosine--tRNA ligase [Oscillospiraceae bacterium]
MTLFEELKAREIIAQTSGDDEVAELINNGKAVFYTGFDPSADSLTAGHFVPLTLMKRLQSAGNKPIVLTGGGTMMVGDPSGRTDMRSMLTIDDIRANAKRFQAQFERFMTFGDGKTDAMAVDNSDWLMKLNYLDFLRDIGVHFSVNRMLAAECYKNRMAQGLTFLEFNYMIMQAYDFYHLNEQFGCNLQLGGDDQWSNILAGADLVRRKSGKQAHALTIALLLTHDGQKMGKTQKGALWLDKSKTSPYEFFQFFRNVHDDDALRYLKRLTFVTMDEIREYEGLTGSAVNEIKERLAFEMTAMVHGGEEANKAKETARGLFSGGAAETMPSTEITAAQLMDDALTVIDALVLCGIAKSKGEARRLIEQGGVTVDEQKVADIAQTIAREVLQNGVVLRKGKKVYHKITLRGPINL